MSEDPAQLAREALEDDRKATPGPWTTNDDGKRESVLIITVDACEFPNIARISHFHNPSLGTDSAFIAAARTREPLLAKALLAKIEECDAAKHDVWETVCERDAAQQSAFGWREQAKANEVTIHNVCDQRDAAEAERDALKAELAEVTKLLVDSDVYPLQCDREELHKTLHEVIRLQGLLAAMTQARDDLYAMAKEHLLYASYPPITREQWRQQAEQRLAVGRTEPESKETT
jgi:hypothetical protein